MKLTGILIGLLFMVVILTSFMTFFSYSNTIYNTQGYDSDSLGVLDGSIEDISQISINTKERIENVKANPLIPDTLGVLVVGGIGGVLTAVSSVDVFIQVIISGIDFLPLGSLNNVLVTALVSALILIFFVGIVAHYIRPSDRL